MIGVRKGLFGRNAGYGSGIVATPEQEAETRRLSAMFPGAAASMPQDMTVRDGGNLAMQAPERKGGFDWKGVLMGALGGAADGAATFFGGQPLIAQQRQFDQAIAARQAEQQRQRAEALADYRAKLGIEAEFAQPEMDAFDRALKNAGIAPDSPQGQALYRQRAETMAGGQDEFVVVPIPGRGTYAGPKSGLPAAMGQGAGASNAPNTLPPDFFSRQNGQQPMQSPAQPITGARTISRNEYNRMLQAFNGDQRLMNVWMRNNNVIAGN